MRFNFAGSQQLATQLEQGAIADVFASADQRWMDYAAEKELLAGEARLFAHNRLVVIVPSTNPARIGRLQDLAKRGVKLVVAAEAVPVGAYTRQSLAKLARTPGLRQGLRSARAGERRVPGGEREGGGDQGAARGGGRGCGLCVRRHGLRLAAPEGVFPIPDQQNVIADYPIAVLKSASAPSAAEDFIGLVVATEGQNVLKKFGLVPGGRAGRDGLARQEPLTSALISSPRDPSAAVACSLGGRRRK